MRPSPRVDHTHISQTWPSPPGPPVHGHGAVAELQSHSGVAGAAVVMPSGASGAVMGWVGLLQGDASSSVFRKGRERLRRKLGADGGPDMADASGKLGAREQGLLWAGRRNLRLR